MERKIIIPAGFNYIDSQDINKDKSTESNVLYNTRQDSVSTIKIQNAPWSIPLLAVGMRSINPAEQQWMYDARSKYENVRQIMDIFDKIVTGTVIVDHCISIRSKSIIDKFNKHYQIIPVSDDPKDIEIKEFIEQNFKRIHNLEQKLLNMLQALIYGYSVSEIILEYKDGKIYIKDIYNYPVQLFAFDTNNNLAYIKDTWTPLVIQEGFFVVHENNPVGWHRYGKSVITKAVYHYSWLIQQVWMWKAQYLSKFASPTAVAEVEKSLSQKDRSFMDEAMINFSTTEGITLPEGVTMKFLNLTQDSSGIYKEAVDYLEESITILLLGQNLTSKVKSGSLAAAEVHNGIFENIIRFDTQNLVNTLNKQLIEPLVKMNFGEDVECPAIVIEEEEAVDLKALSEMYDILINKVGIEVPKEYAYGVFGIPMPAAGDKILKKEIPIAKPFVGKPIENDIGIGNDNKKNIDTEKTEEKDKNDDNKKTENESEETTAFVECECGDSINFSMKLGTKQQVNLLDDWAKNQIPAALEGLKPLKKQINNVLKEAKKKQLNLYQIRAIQIKPSTAVELKPITNAMEKLIFSSYLFGMHQASLETPIVSNFAEDQLYLYPEEPFEFLEAMKFFSDKVIATSDEMTDVFDFMKQKSFYLAEVNDNWLITKLYEEIDKAISRGLTLNEFIENADSFFDRQGVERIHPYRLETLFRTEILNAYRVGRYAQMTNPAVKKVYGYWKYQAVMDSGTRPEHASRNGTTLSQDDPWWTSNYPGGFNCRCFVSSIRTSDITNGIKTATDKRSKEFLDLEPMKDNFNPNDYWNIKK